MIDTKNVIHPIVYKDNFTLWELPPGKPDGNQKLEDPYNDQRDRRPQSKQKYGTCFYYAMKGLVPLYGKKCGNFVEARSHEKAWSQYRKQITLGWEINQQSLTSFHEICTQLNDKGKVISKAALSECIKNATPVIDPSENQSKECLITQEAMKQIRAFIDSDSIEPTFWETEGKPRYDPKQRLNQWDELNDQFAKYALEQRHQFIWTVRNDMRNTLSMAVEKIVLAHMLEENWRNIVENTVSEMTPELKEKTASQWTTLSVEDQKHLASQWNSFNLTAQSTLMSSAIHKHYSTQVYGFQKSPWHPKQSIDALIKQLQNCGPMLSCGYMGKSYYTKDPLPLETKIEGLTVHAWKPPAVYKKPDDYALHAIVITGAREVSGKGYVYFYDPETSSKPGEQRQILLVSYDRFCSTITDMRKGLSPDHPCAQPIEEQTYLLYNPKLPNFRRV